MPKCPHCHQEILPQREGASVCPQCFEEFIPKRANQKFCSPECRTAFHNNKLMERYYEAKQER